MKKNYLFLMKTNQVYGAERRIISILNHVDYNNYSITLAVNDINIFNAYIRDRNLPITVTQLPLDTKIGIVKKFIRFYKFFQDNKPDVIIFSQFFLSSFSLPELLAGKLVTRNNNYMIVHDSGLLYKKYKSRLHFGIIPGVGLQWRLERFSQRKLVYFVKHTLAVSKGVEETLIKTYQYPQNKIKLFFHGVETKRFLPNSNVRETMRNKFSIPANDIVIISTARLERMKCIDKLINAFESVSQKFSSCHLLLIGDGPEKNNLEILTKQKSSQVKIKFLGPHKDVSSHLKMSDIFILPSEIEGFGNALLEAMSTGLICVATKTAGPSEIIKDGINGFLVEISELGILDGLTKALTLGEEERRQIAHNARKFIEYSFDIEKRVNEEINILGLNKGFDKKGNNLSMNIQNNYAAHSWIKEFVFKQKCVPWKVSELSRILFNKYFPWRKRMLFLALINKYKKCNLPKRSYHDMWLKTRVNKKLSLLDNAIIELQEYFGLPKKMIIDSLSHSEDLFTDEWNKFFKERTIEETTLIQFYDTSHKEIFDLMQWHYVNYFNGPLQYVFALNTALERNLSDYLDYGSGIGTGGILFAQHNFNVTLADISSSNLKFCNHRLKSRKLKADFIDLKIRNIYPRAYNIITCFDVLEHTIEPLKTIAKLRDGLRNGGLLLLNAPFGEDEQRPMHIAKDKTIIDDIKSMDFSLEVDLIRQCENDINRKILAFKKAERRIPNT